MQWVLLLQQLTFPHVIRNRGAHDVLQAARSREKNARFRGRCLLKDFSIDHKKFLFGYDFAMRRSIFPLLFLIASAVSADESPLITRWRDAIGAVRGDATHRAYAIDEDGMAGTRDEWITPALQRRDVVRHEHDETTTVYDGTHGWRRDWNGFVEKLAGFDLDREGNLAFLHSLAAFTTTPNATGPDWVEFRKNLRITFDPATGLPASATMPSFDGSLTVAFSDWQSVDGVRFPFTETWKTGPNTSTAHLKSVEFIPPDRVDLTPLAPGPEDAFFLRTHATAEAVPFNFDNNHIMVLTTVNGVGPIWFLIDTGAPYTIINQSRVSEFHLTPYGGLKTIGGGSSSTSGSFVDHVTYRIGEVELRDQHAGVLELRGLERLYGMPMGGILGFDFLSRFVEDIDYDKKTVTLHPRADTNFKGTEVPLLLQGEQPYLGGSITVAGETIPAWFILDVGAADTLTFTTPFVAAHRLIDRAGDQQKAVHKYAAPDIEAFNPTNVRGLLDGVTIGGITLPHVLVNFSAAKSGAYTSPVFDANIGETLLSRFSHVILDYRRSLMILVPGPNTAKPFEERKSFGMTIVAGATDMHQFTVTAVGDNSGASAAGFQKGDVITAVDATPAASLNLAALQKLLKQEGSDHDFAVRRGAQDLTLHAHIAMKPVSSL